MPKAVFLDRDGTVIVDKGYLDSEEGVELLQGAAQALKRLAEAGFLLVLVTNQSGIGRGYFSKDIVDKQHQRLNQLLAPCNVKFDAIEVCPHAPQDKCECRKPNPALLLRAAQRLNIELRDSFMIGDKRSDIETGRNAGCRCIILGTPIPEADFAAANMAEAATFILECADKKEPCTDA